MKRLYIALGLLAITTVGIYLAFIFSRPVPYKSGLSESYTYILLFNPGAWLIPLSALLGIFFRASRKPLNNEQELINGKVLRHDEHMFFSHWSHVLAILMLMLSGLVKGPLFLPRLIHTPEAAGFTLNLHFIGIVIFVFGLFYYMSGLIIEGNFKELLPGAKDIKDAIFYYTSKLGIGEEPKQGKFLASEKLAYPIWIILVLGISITGGVKVAAHLWSFPGSLMCWMTFMHDIFALGILLLLLVHILLGALVPWSWPLLVSMMSGYVSEEYAKKKHALWYEELRRDS
jgi:cytochrome b subunit of formate dehydrogenase